MNVWSPGARPVSTNGLVPALCVGVCEVMRVCVGSGAET